MSDGEAVVQHLIFHRALLGDHEGGEHLARYLEMVKQVEAGLVNPCADPTERLIYTVFECAIDGHFDPWDIDLVAFAHLYLENVKKEGAVNFVTAGKLLLLAWSVLGLQSHNVLERAKPVESVESYFADWEFDAGTFVEPGDFAHALLQGQMPPLSPAIRRRGSRPVTLLDLVDALAGAQRDAAEYAAREAARAQAVAVKATTLGDKVHKEDLLEDLRVTWARLCEHDGGEVPLRSLWNHDPWDRATVFMAILFLAKMERVRLRQEAYPFGEIFVKRLAEEDVALALEAAPETHAAVA